MTLFNKMKRDTLRELTDILKIADYDVANIQSEFKAHVTDYFFDMEVYIGEGLPYNVEISSEVFFHYTKQWYEENYDDLISDDDLKRIARDVDSGSTLDEDPYLFLYHSMDNRTQKEITDYVINWLFSDLLSEYFPGVSPLNN